MDIVGYGFTASNKLKLFQTRFKDLYIRNFILSWIAVILIGYWMWHLPGYARPYMTYIEGGKPSPGGILCLLALWCVGVVLIWYLLATIGSQRKYISSLIGSCISGDRTALSLIKNEYQSVSRHQAIAQTLAHKQLTALLFLLRSAAPTCLDNNPPEDVIKDIIRSVTSSNDAEKDLAQIFADIPEDKYISVRNILEYILSYQERSWEHSHDYFIDLNAEVGTYLEDLNQFENEADHGFK